MGGGGGFLGGGGGGGSTNTVQISGLSKEPGFFMPS